MKEFMKLYLIALSASVITLCAKSCLSDNNGGDKIAAQTVAPDSQGNWPDNVDWEPELEK